MQGVNGMWMHSQPGAIFVMGSPTHWMILLLTALSCFALLALGRAAARRGASAGFDRCLAAALLLVWVAMVASNLLPGRLRLDRSLPLHICGLVGLLAPLALLTGWRPLRAVVYFWGLGLCSQSFVLPVMWRGYSQAEFCLFWAFHIGIVAAAVVEIGVRGYRPCWRDWQQAMLAIAAYAVTMAAVDAWLHVNYGFVGPAEISQLSAIRRFGDWPARVPRLVIASWSVMALLALPTAAAQAYRSLPSPADLARAYARSVFMSMTKRYFTSPLSIRSQA
jgi:hypothetical integral membrane protein (TIGR02206 family)